MARHRDGVDGLYSVDLVMALATHPPQLPTTELCPRCGSPATSCISGRYGCDHCGMEWAERP